MDCQVLELLSACVAAVLDIVDYTFSENGLMAHKGTDLLATASLKSFLGEDKLKALISYVLHYIADLDIPIKRGTFIEFRNGMLNVSPIGRNCSQEERDEFERYDKDACVRYSPCFCAGTRARTLSPRRRVHDSPGRCVHDFNLLSQTPAAIAASDVHLVLQDDDGSRAAREVCRLRPHILDRRPDQL